ncbi:FUSC family protein (plasmid) [Streptomyces sp. BI20]|uniref:FUSC family protein n=1 Tax=Streptomyces sp. BI20 TaxID=3403460 RepID=UPI003C7675C0
MSGTPTHLGRLVNGFGDGVMVLKTVLAAALSWWVAADLLHLDAPGLAPAGAVLVAQVTPYATALKSLQRAAGIVVGVLLGAAVAALGGGGLLTVTLVTLIGLFAGRLLRLGAQVHQIALTGILVVAGSDHLGYGTERIEENVLGVLVGTVIALLVPSPGFTRRAREETARLTRDMAALLAEIADRVGAEDWAGHTGDWVRRARHLSGRLDDVRSAVRRAHEAARRPGGRPGRRAPSVARLAEAAAALDHVGHQLRGITRGLYDLTYREGRAPALHHERAEDPAGPAPDARVAPGLDAVFGALARVLAEIADHRLDDAPPDTALDPGLRRLLGVAESAFLTAAGRQSPSYLRWQVLCTAGILEDTRRMLHELDPDLGPHRAAFR